MPRKGGDFERELCRTLSLWFSGGKRDDLLWRSSQSGGRATARARKGQTTAGHCGDICATCPEGEPITRKITWELKRGYNKTARMSDLLTYSYKDWENAKKGTLPAFIHQSEEAAERARTIYWILIHRPDRGPAIVYMTVTLCRKLELPTSKMNAVRFRAAWYTLYAMTLDDFLKHCKPSLLSKL